MIPAVQGVLDLASGARYEGEFAHGTKDGRGEMWFPAMNGRYYGDFKDGQLEGWGEMVFANGDRSLFLLCTYIYIYI